MTAATHSEFSIKSNFCLKDIPTSPGLCFDEEKVHNRWCRDPDRVPASSPENFQLNKDFQTESFCTTKGWVSAVSNPKEPLRPVQIFILCAVREELTDSCRVWLTKLSSKKFIFRDESYPLFRQGRLALRANICYPLFWQGRIGYPLFLQGRLALRANICYPLFWQGRIDYPLFMQGRLA